IPKRQYYAPRHERGWLKPLLYCAGCGRQMVCKTIRGKQAYHCITSVYRSNRPGDARFQTGCGFNCVRHDDVEALIMKQLDGLKLEMEKAVEEGALTRLEEEIAAHRETILQAAGNGCKGYLREVRADLELDGNPSSKLAKLVEAQLTADPEEED